MSSLVSLLDRHLCRRIGGRNNESLSLIYCHTQQIMRHISFVFHGSDVILKEEVIS